MRFETKAIHAGQPPDPATGAVITPVYQTATYRQSAIGVHKGYEYSRTNNPTRQALEQALAAVEEGTTGIAFASGSAATAAVFQLAGRDGHIIAGSDLYGGTYRLLEKVFAPWGVDVSVAENETPEAVQKLLKPNTRLIWVESPTNPLLKILDIPALAAIARQAGARLAVDNTFASPYNQRPLTMGADIVAHSTTKYIGGHSDLVGGAVVVSDAQLAADLKFYQNAAGAVPGPWDCWLALRGLKTLAARMRVHEQNALALARFLADHPKVAAVHYPGLPGHPQHELARRQMDGFGGMLSVELNGGFPSVEKFTANLRLFTLAESLGGIESLAAYPSRMTHAGLSEADRARRGIVPGLVRLSVGIEHVEDLRDDLKEALAAT